MKYKLSEHSIDAVSEEANAYLLKRKTKKKDRIHTRLSIEKVLLRYLYDFGSDTEFTVDYGRWGSAPDGSTRAARTRSHTPR